MISVDAVFASYFPQFLQRKTLIRRPVLAFLRMLCHEREFQQFEYEFPHIEGIDFVEHVLNYFDFSYSVRSGEIERIPTSGRLVIIANHPIGSLDGLALLQMIYRIRRDVKVVGNQLLMQLKPLHSLLLPVDNMSHKTARSQLKAIEEHLDNEGVVIIFPAGEVSRLGPMGIRDGKWNTGFLRFASKAKAPILPLFVDARNSTFFYSLSLIAKPISTLWLIREMFKHARNNVPVRVGHAIPYDQYVPLLPKKDALAKRFRDHLYDIGKGRKPRWENKSGAAIAHPEDRVDLIQELRRCKTLGFVGDKRICLYQYSPNSAIMRELGRLREISFRAVGEGSGKRLDIDHFDRMYDHLILWDEENLEIVGAYRMRQTSSLSQDQASPSLYTQTLFEFTPKIAPYLAEGLELGRSFIQPKYWNRRNLDILWYGIGAYLKKHPEIRYLFGPVSLSNSLPPEAREHLVAFYGAHFPDHQVIAVPRTPYRPTIHHSPYSGMDYKQEFSELKSRLAALGTGVPTLYKQYTELCEEQGVFFAGFNIDADFSNCLDGLVVVDLNRIKLSKRQRYIDNDDNAQTTN